MCGIVGYYGKKQAFDILIGGLKKLEYRGYDSSGISIISSDLQSISTQKEIGHQKDILFDRAEGSIGIAHTRWATHGKVTKVNTHPHTDCKDEIYIVHNGIIKNYKFLKEMLIYKGHKFRSETDTEVLAHLVEEQLNKSHTIEAAFAISVQKLEGDYSIMLIKKGEKTLLGARRGTVPLCIGISDEGIFPASDVLAFTEYTNKAIFLKSGDTFIKDKKGLRIYNTETFKKVEREIQTVLVDDTDTHLGMHKHYMIKEISEQGEALMRAITQDTASIKEICKLMKESEKVFFIGCGSSYNACLAAFYLFSGIANYQVTPVLSSEYWFYKKFFNDKTLVVAVSQSGETADILTAVESAKEKGCKVVSIVNRENSILSQMSDISLFNKCGTEICVLSTKSYITQVAIISIIAYHLADKYEEGIQKLKNLYVDVFNLTSTTMRELIQKVAKKICKSNDLYIIGRGVQYPTALEAALKIKEVSYTHAEAFAGGELKHGNLALIDKNTPCIALIPYTPKWTQVSMNLDEANILSDTEEIKSRGGYIIGVGFEQQHTFNIWIKVPDSGELNPITQIIPMQLLAYELALLKGLDPDKPRNLAKSVTVS